MSPMITRVATVVSLTTALLAGVACSPSVPPPEQRTFRHQDGRFTYVVPPGWIVWMGEARSPKGSLFSATLGVMLLQGVLHSKHHQAQGVNALKRLGAAWPELDYMYRVRKAV